MARFFLSARNARSIEPAALCLWEKRGDFITRRCPALLENKSGPFFLWLVCKSPVQK